MRIRHGLRRGLALALGLSLAVLPAGAAETAVPAAEATQSAVEYAMQYGGAVSIQYALWDNGETVLEGHAGVYSRTEERALDGETLYGIGSVSKLYTTAAVMKLAEAGLLELDRPVTDYLPEFRMADARYPEITVRMLLNHSSGLMGSTFHNTMLFQDPDRSAVDDLLEELSTQRLKADPGEFSVYCNDGFTLAQLVVEAVSGQTFRTYVRQALLSPAGLEDTYFPGEDMDASRLARTYLGGDTRALPQEMLAVHGTGGIYASAAGLAAFGGALCAPGLLTQASLDAMAAPEYANGLWPEDTEDTLAYGLGWDSVQWYPFTYSGIQALTKGGDTTLYHAALVVLPEYGLSCAVLSSGGVSTYNEMAASRILIAALAERGVAVEESAHTLPAAQPAALPEGELDHAGQYASSLQVVQATLDPETGLTLGGQNFRYYSDGSYRDEAQSVMLKFVTEENGRTYLWQKAYAQLPGLGGLPSSSYTHVKLEENPVSPEVQEAWDARNGKLYLCVDEKHTSQLLALALPAAGLASTPGYMAFDRIVDADYAEGAAVIPGLAGRDWQNVQAFRSNGVEYVEILGRRYLDADGIGPIYAGSSSYCTIQEGGEIRWYRVDAAAGKTMSIQVPEDGGFTVYDAGGQVTAASWAYGDQTAVLPEGGWIAFAGEPGVRFQIAMQ